MVLMSGVQPSAHDNGVVETVLGIAIGVIIIGVGVYTWRGRAGSDAMLWALGIGGIIVLLASWNLVSKISDLPTRDPVVIVRADLNDWEDIRFDLIKMFLFQILCLGIYEIVVVTPSNRFPSLVAILSEAPILVAAVLGVEVFFVLEIMFGSYRGTGRKGRF